jgi:hypothetical protein
MDISIREGVTLGIAILGAALGVINLWRAFDRDRVNVKVIPKGYVTSHGTSGICIEVVNLGFIPVTVSQVGFTLPTTREWYAHRSLLEGLPKRLEPRTAFTAYLTAGEEKHPAFGAVGRAFVQTQCGRVFHGKSASLRSHIKAARASKDRSS